MTTIGLWFIHLKWIPTNNLGPPVLVSRSDCPPKKSNKYACYNIISSIYTWSNSGKNPTRRDGCLAFAKSLETSWPQTSRKLSLYVTWTTSALMPRSQQTFRPIPTVKLLRIMLRNRCWATTLHTITAEDVDGWCQNCMVWSTPQSNNPLSSINLRWINLVQCLGKFRGIIGQNPSASQPNWLHVMIFQFLFVYSRYIP